jgi:hypothetical protein
MSGGRRLSAKHILPLATGVFLTLAGCGTYVPNIQENPWASDPNRLVQAIVESIHCEVINAVVYVINEDRATYWSNPQQGLKADWLNKWGAQMQITLTTDEQSSLSPSGSYSPNIFTLLGGANLSSEATRTDILNFYYTVTNLYGKGTGCTPKILSDLDLGNHPVGSLLIQSDLKLRDWLSAVVLGVGTEQIPITKPAGVTNPSFSNAILHDVKFQVTTSGNITPIWKLALATINPAAPFATASRTRTHELIITFGPNDPTTNSLGPNTPAAGAFLSQQIGSAIGNTVSRNSVISNSVISNIVH